ncbi:MAG: hypothetical protein CVV20_04865, partial [Gemmatimonadetes bacterium HGW-Gemmatimonadetes-1]
MNALLDRLVAGFAEIWTILPALFGSVVILITGYFVARTLERFVDRLLVRMDFNRVAEEGGLRDAVDRTGARL